MKRLKPKPTIVLEIAEIADNIRENDSTHLSNVLNPLFVHITISSILVSPTQNNLTLPLNPKNLQKYSEIYTFYTKHRLIHGTTKVSKFNCDPLSPVDLLSASPNRLGPLVPLVTPTGPPPSRSLKGKRCHRCLAARWEPTTATAFLKTGGFICLRWNDIHKIRTFTWLHVHIEC